MGETDISRVIQLIHWTRPVLIGPALSRGLDQTDAKGPFQLALFCDSN